VGVFGSFVYGGEGVGGDVYGPDVDVLSIDLISADVLRIRLDLPVIVDAAYNDPTNYTISVLSGPGQALHIREVLPIQTDTASDIMLVIDRIDKGTTYVVTVGAAITSTKGQNVVGSSQFVGRSTKTENMIKGLPAHFNKTPKSTIRNIMAAIGISDDLIGGSLDAPRG